MSPVDSGTVELLDSAWIGEFGSGGQLIEAEAPADAEVVKAFKPTSPGRCWLDT